MPRRPICRSKRTRSRVSTFRMPRRSVWAPPTRWWTSWMQAVKIDLLQPLVWMRPLQEVTLFSWSKFFKKIPRQVARSRVSCFAVIWQALKRLKRLKQKDPLSKRQKWLTSHSQHLVMWSMPWRKAPRRMCSSLIVTPNWLESCKSHSVAILPHALWSLAHSPATTIGKLFRRCVLAIELRVSRMLSNVMLREVLKSSRFYWQHVKASWAIRSSVSSRYRLRWRMPSKVRNLEAILTAFRTWSCGFIRQKTLRN